MDKQQIDYPKLMEMTTTVLGSYGALLVANDHQGKPNVMTIGWGTIGSIWARPVFLVLVRPSRYSYTRLEEAGDFTENTKKAILEKARMILLDRLTNEE
jgi:flavin reductase (DIM6/NTAB) family NADH-FMN oxidoreductase RutF